MRPLKSYTFTLALAGMWYSAQAAPSAAPPKPRGLMAMLQKGMTGHAVIAVGTGGYEIRDKTYDEAAFTTAKDEVGRLQVISKAASTDAAPLIPFAVGKAWVIAPQYRQDPRTDFSGVTPLGAMPYDDLITRAVLSLSPDQMARAEGGIPFPQLPKEAQTALMLAIRPPFRIATHHDATITLPNGTQTLGWEWTDNARVTEPIDWARVRFRARLVMESAYVQPPGSKVGVSLGDRRPGKPTIILERRTWGSDIPIYNDAPNTFRPTDLGTQGLDKPIGVAGILTVADVVAQLSKVTGLRLSAMPAFRYAPAFVGNASLSCGDVADGLRLALTGTWRRVGDAYVLAWDKPGWAADRLRVEEATAGLSDAIQKLTESQKEAPAWLDVAENLPFDPDDPLTPTDEQRRRLFALDWKPDTTDPDRPPEFPGNVEIPYDDMTAAQQKYLLEASKTARITTYDESMRDISTEPATAADVQAAKLGMGTSLHVSLDLPGFGWVETQQAARPGDLNVWTLYRIRSKAAMEAWRKGEAARHANDPHPFQPKPSALPAQSRGLLVPTLGPSQVTEIIGRMKAHGLDTLLYPALDAGYATFPSKAFPLDPALRGKDGWAAAAAAAKQAGIRLVAWLSPVAWQEEGQKVHWLDKHRDWLDVDALGRTPLEWRARHPAQPGAEIFPPHLAAFNYVRPAEPEVARRLDTLVDECARLPGAAGLAILDWRIPEPERGRRADVPPPLGFALPDRIAALRADGTDPVDDVSRSTYANSAWQFPDVLGILGWNQPPKDSPDAKPKRPLEETRFHDLAARVLSRAEAARKDWQTWRVDIPAPDQPHYGPPEDAPLPPLAPPPADISLRVAPPEGNQTAKYDGYTLPIPPRSYMQGQEIPESVRKYPPIAMLGMMAADMSMRNPPAKVALYDFRAVPSDIMDSLRWIVAPGKG